MSLNDFNFVPPCLRDPSKVTSVYDCLVGGDDSVGGYWINLLFFLTIVASFIYLLYGAYLMITAYGDESKFTQAKKTITYALIGIIVAGVASFLVSAFVDLLTL